MRRMHQSRSAGILTAACLVAASAVVLVLGSIPALAVDPGYWENDDQLVEWLRSSASRQGTAILPDWVDRFPNVTRDDLVAAVPVIEPYGYGADFARCAVEDTIVVQPGDQRPWYYRDQVDPSVVKQKAISEFFVPGATVRVFRYGDAFVAKACGNFSVSPGPIPGELRVIKFDDSNMNGVQDPGEAEVGGWPVSYSGPQNGGGTTTLAVQLPAGTYTVSEEQRSHWLHTTPSSVAAEIRSCQTTTVRFGNVRLGSITVRKFDDADMDGAKDPGETDPGFPVVLQGTAVNGVPQGPFTGTTPVTFENLPPGDYYVCEDLDWVAHPFIPDRVMAQLNGTWWMATTPTCVGPIHLGEGVDRDQDAFGNVELGSIAGIKWDDTDCDHQKDSAEVTLDDWQIALTGNDLAGESVTPPPVMTGPNGAYGFDYLPPSDLLAGYRVSERLDDPEHWGPTTPLSLPCTGPLPDPVAPQPHQIVLGEGEDRTGVDFGNVRLGKICGFKYYDANAALPPYDPRNGNGQYDPGEPFLPDWEFTLTGVTDLLDNCEEPAPIQPRIAVTDENGVFCFPRLYPSHVGNGYEICEVKPAKWILTVPQHLCRSTWLDEGEEISEGFEYGNLRIVPLGARTIGYWKTHPEAITPRMYAALSALPAFSGVNTWKKLYPILNGANAVDMKVMLRAHLLGLTLNVLAGIVPADTWVYIGNIPGARDLFGANIVTAQYVLGTIEGAYPWTSWTRAQQEAAKNVCDAANNNANLVSPTP